MPDPARYSTELEILAALGEKEDIVLLLAESPAEAFAALRRWVGAPSEQLLEAVGRYAAKLETDQLAELVHGAIASAFELEPTEAFFAAARLADAEEGRVIEAIIGLFEKAGNETRRDTVLDIWQWADPHSRDERRRLIEEVFLRLAEGGPTTHDLARRRLELLVPPPGDADVLVDRLRASAPDDGRRKKLERRLEQVGLVQAKRKGILGRLRLG